jgi:hypothetical protein
MLEDRLRPGGPMPYQTKIATCSYCGSRQTLTLSARGGP